MLKKRPGPKIGTIGEVIGVYQPCFTHSKFFSERSYEIRYRVFLHKEVMRFVKKRQGPKIDIIGEVIGVYQPCFTHSKFFSERGYEIRHRVFLHKGVMRFVKKIDTIK